MDRSFASAQEDIGAQDDKNRNRQIYFIKLREYVEKVNIADKVWEI